jgi:peptidyl-prolyl cis-trans isomerase B (cyclophilin B)
VAGQPAPAQPAAKAAGNARAVGVGEHQVAPGPQDPGGLGEGGIGVDQGDEIEMGGGEGQRSRLAGLEGDAPLGVEADPGGGGADRTLGAVDPADPRPRELAREEQGPVALAALHLEHPLGLTDQQRRGGERGQGRSRHGAIVARGGLGFCAVEARKDQRWIILAVFAVLAAVVIGVILISRSGGSDDDSTTSATSTAKNGCKEVEAPEPKEISLKAPEQTVQPGEELTAVVQTSCGSFSIALDTKQAPKTANSFAYLAEEGFYDDLAFPRIVPGFVIQAGSPENTTNGDAGYSITEAPPANLEYTKGIVAMAKTEAEPPGRSGSQFFVVTGADAGLPAEYALVGKVSEGMDVVEKIGEEGTAAEKPKQTILIESITVEPGRGEG